MPTTERKYSPRIAFALFAVLALAQAGCLLAVAGAAAGAGTAGYFYYKGRLYRDFAVPLPDVRNATHAALLDLHFILLTDDAKDGKAFILTRTADGKKVRIYLDVVTNPIPAEGTLTRVSIRVATFGDEGVTARIFDQIALRLSHPAPIVPIAPGPTPIISPVPAQQTGFQTTEPKPAPVKPAEPQP